ncbi:hypothetical protein GGD83_004619 [Rhodoblastus sphagnicola]|nr:DUF2865 domain-containing protein [Rhodoblastus sphagnicola]MBB4200790.1 hypothetical protein [Rhodoblastus sphagnicola]
MARRIARGLIRLSVALLCAAPLAGALAQPLDCERLRAAIDSTPRGDSAQAQAAAQVRVDYERLAARADAIGCNNQQFLFFGSPPPPECGGIRQRLAAMRAQYESMRVRGADMGRRQALIAQYAQQCGGETPVEDEPPRESRGAPRGGGEAVCVRKCDGYYFPLTPAMTGARVEALRDLCQALCPDAEVGLYSRVAQADISNALSADSGDRYDDLPNALKYQKKFDPSCACKKPRQGWAEVLGRAEQILTDIDGERPGEGPLTPKQADDRSHVQPGPKVDEKALVKPKKRAKPEPPPVSPLDPPGLF